MSDATSNLPPALDLVQFLGSTEDINSRIPEDAGFLLDPAHGIAQSAKVIYNPKPI